MSGTAYSSTNWMVTSSIVTSRGLCVYCGSQRNLVAHHKVPREYGGSDALSNLERVCRRCHPAVEPFAKEKAAAAGQRRVAPVRPAVQVRRKPSENALLSAFLNQRRTR